MDRDRQFIVNLNHGYCTCKVWDCEEIPCAHALAVLRMLNEDPYSFTASFYFTRTLSETYRGVIRPVGVQEDWRAQDDVSKALPPIVKRQAGRPKKQRIPSIGEFKSSIRCTQCNLKGHNSKTCKLNKR